jgi:hypothetical protein
MSEENSMIVFSVIGKKLLSPHADTEVLIDPEFSSGAFVIPWDGWLIELEACQLTKAARKEDEIPVKLRVDTPDVQFYFRAFVPYPPANQIFIPRRSKEILDLFRLKAPLKLGLPRGARLYVYASLPLSVERPPLLMVKLTFDSRM